MLKDKRITRNYTNSFMNLNNTWIFSNKDIEDIYQVVLHYIGEPPNELLKDRIKFFLSKIDPRGFPSNRKRAIPKIAKYFLQQYYKQDSNENIHDYQRHLIRTLDKGENQWKYAAGNNKHKKMGDTILDFDEEGFFKKGHVEEIERRHFTWQTYLSINLPKIPMLLDTRYARDYSQSSNRILWDLTYTGNVGKIGNVNISHEKLSNVIAFRICPFWLPITSNHDVYYKQIHLYVANFANKNDYYEFLGSNEDKATENNYHFTLDIIERDEKRIKLLPCREFFYFNNPMTCLDYIDIQLKTPFNVYSLPLLKQTVSLATGNPTILTSPTAHELATGDLVYFLGYGNEEVDRTKGHFIIRINSTQFAVNVDTTAEDPADILAIYGSKRFFIEFEFLCLE